MRLSGLIYVGAGIIEQIFPKSPVMSSSSLRSYYHSCLFIATLFKSFQCRLSLDEKVFRSNDFIVWKRIFSFAFQLMTQRVRVEEKKKKMLGVLSLFSFAFFGLLMNH